MAFNSIEEVSDRHLHILWTNGDAVTAQHMVFMYARNSMLNHWWDRVTVILWGAPQLLILENEAVREAMKEAVLAGASSDFVLQSDLVRQALSTLGRDRPHMRKSS